MTTSVRRVIRVPGLEHRSPIPVATEIRGTVFTSAITGKDEHGAFAPDPAEQIARAFDNVQRVLDAAGLSRSEIAHVTIFLQDLRDRRHVDPIWTEWFPDPDDRPARHAVQTDLFAFHDGLRLQVELVAVRAGA